MKACKGLLTLEEFQKVTVGWDRCDKCGSMKPLVWANDRDIGVLLEIMPEGRPQLVCFDCFHTSDYVVRDSK